MMSCVLAIDQSTSSTKAVLFDAQGGVIDKAARDHPQIYPQPGWVEHDAELLYANTLAALGTLAARQAHQLAHCACLSISNQRETFVVFERETGRPLHHAIVWQCRRGDDVCRRLAHDGHAEYITARTGLPLDSYFPAPKLTWLLEQRPDIRGALTSGRALFGTIDTYLIYRLTRGTVHATDHSNASRTLVYDIHTQAWNSELCALFGIPPCALPEIRESADVFGETDAEGRLPAPVPICGVMGDSQAALFAQRCFTPGSAKVTLGTGSSVLVNIGAAPRRGPRGIATTMAWRLHGAPVYAFEGNVHCTGATIAWLKDQLGIMTHAAESEAAARRVPDNGGVCLTMAACASCPRLPDWVRRTGMIRPAPRFWA